MSHEEVYLVTALTASGHDREACTETILSVAGKRNGKGLSDLSSYDEKHRITLWTRTIIKKIHSNYPAVEGQCLVKSELVA